MFNVTTFDGVEAWIERNRESFNFVYWNMMHDAWYFSIACLPDLVKQQVTQRLRNAPVCAEFRPEFEKIIDFMNNGASSDGSTTCMKIAELDRRRGTDFVTVSPEMAGMLNYRAH